MKRTISIFAAAAIAAATYTVDLRMNEGKAAIAAVGEAQGFVRRLKRGLRRLGRRIRRAVRRAARTIKRAARQVGDAIKKGAKNASKWLKNAVKQA